MKENEQIIELENGETMTLQDWIACQAVSAKVERNELRLQNRRLYSIIFAILGFVAASLPAMFYLGWWMAAQHELQLEMLEQIRKLWTA